MAEKVRRPQMQSRLQRMTRPPLSCSWRTTPQQRQQKRARLPHLHVAHTVQRVGPVAVDPSAPPNTKKGGHNSAKKRGQEEIRDVSTIVTQHTVSQTADVSTDRDERRQQRANFDRLGSESDRHGTELERVLFLLHSDLLPSILGVASQIRADDVHLSAAKMIGEHLEIERVELRGRVGGLLVERPHAVEPATIVEVPVSVASQIAQLNLEHKEVKKIRQHGRDGTGKRISGSAKREHPNECHALTRASARAQTDRIGICVGDDERLPLTIQNALADLEGKRRGGQMRPVEGRRGGCCGRSSSARRISGAGCSGCTAGHRLGLHARPREMMQP